MSLNNRPSFTVFVFTVALAMMLKITPWPMPIPNFMPDWVLLTLIYWSLEQPDRYGVITGWIIGLFVDVLTGRLLGQYALGFALIIYLCLKQHRRLQHLPFLQQGLFILVLMFLSQFIIFWTENLKHSTQFQTAFWLPVVTGTLIWPIFHHIMTRIRMTFNIL